MKMLARAAIPMLGGAMLAGVALYLAHDFDRPLAPAGPKPVPPENRDTSMPHPSSGETTGLVSPGMLERVRGAGSAAPERGVGLTAIAMRGAEALPQTEQQSLWQAFSKARRAIRPVTAHQLTMPENGGARFLASNPGQRIRARFLEQGVRLLSGYAGRDWETVLSLAADLENGAPEIRREGTRLEYAHGGIVEWYHNRPEGIEHGYIVERKTEAFTSPGDGVLRVPLRVSGLTVEPLAERDEGSSDLQFVNAAGEPVLSYTDLRAWDATGAELSATMRPAGDGHGLHILVADVGASYPVVIDPLLISLEQKLGPNIPGSGALGDAFGNSVSVQGDTAVISAGGDDDNGFQSGSVYVFTRAGNSWFLQQTLAPSDPTANDYFGASVSMNGDTLLIGAYWDDDNGTNSGSAYVFTRRAGEKTWLQQQKLIAGDGATYDEFGRAVSLDGDTALVGAIKDDDNGSDSGSAYVFTRSGGTWTEQQKLVAADGVAYDEFGKAVCVEGDTALVGVYQNDDIGTNSGSAYVFTRSGGTWSAPQLLIPADNAAVDHFGVSVCVEGDTALIGASADSDTADDAGSVYVYTRSGGTWAEQQELTAGDGAEDDYFGASVCLDGGTALIGALGDDDNGDGSGSVYVFTRSGSTWSEHQKLTTGDGRADDRFGNSVSLDGDTALIGAYGDDSSGSAYVFTRNGGSWLEQQKLMTGDGAGDDELGCSVSVDGNTALIGAPGDDDNGSDSGSAYVFTRSGGVWSEQQKLLASDGTTNDYFGGSVSLNGDTALVGAPWDDYNLLTNTGAAFVFTRSGGTWTQQQKLTAAIIEQGALFGISVSVDGDTAFIGAMREPPGGGAYVLTRSGGTWTQQQILTASDGDHGDEFGCSVSVDGDTALVGAWYNDDSGRHSGGAYVFRHSGGTWTEEQKLVPGDGTEYDYFGGSVTLDGDTALVGAHQDDDNGSNSGSAYVFRHSGGTWTGEQKLTAADGAESDYFGFSVSLDGGTALVGANGDDDNGSDSGSAYVFTRSGGTWTERQKLTGPDGAADDEFGYSVCLSGDTAMIGARFDDGMDLRGRHLAGSGSVYVFRLATIGMDTDGDGGSDAWETANDFSMLAAYDFVTQDTDDDGRIDLLEIFQGTDKTLSASAYGLVGEPVVAGSRTLKARYRRSTGDTGVSALYRWSTDCNNWHANGIDAEGCKVDFADEVVASGTGYEIVEVTATVTLGSARNLFICLELKPNQ